jgi:hypothetical protein
MTTIYFREVEDLRFAGDDILITIDGHEYSFPLGQVSRRLSNATEKERGHFEISASGYGIHWPDVDEDLSVEGLLRTAGTVG